MHSVSLLFNILILVSLIWISLFVCTLLHEMGHAFMYSVFFREKDWHITIGTGKPIIKLKKYTVNILPLSGKFNYISKYRGSKLQCIMMSLGGPMVDLFLIVILVLALYMVKTSETTILQHNLIWILVFNFYQNVYSFIGAIVPIDFKIGSNYRYISDGMQIVREVIEKRES